MATLKISNLAFVVLLFFISLNVQAQTLNIPAKRSLLETFTNLPCTACTPLKQAFYDTFYMQERHNSILIEFYPGFPDSTCPFYLANPEENIIRSAHRNIDSVPMTVINGESYFRSDSITNSILEALEGQVTPYYVNAEQNYLDDSVASVDFTLGSINEHFSDSFRFFAAVVNEYAGLIDVPAGWDSLQMNSLNHFLTDPKGEVIFVDETVDTIHYEFLWTNPSNPISDKSALAWIEDLTTNEIINVGYPYFWPYDYTIPDTLPIMDTIPIDSINMALRRLDSITLTKIYNDLDGSNWRYNWNFNRPIENWIGVETDEESTRVIGLSLARLELDRISSFISDLSALLYLDLSDNNLTGIVPSELDTLALLKWLDISNNGYTTIPNELGALSDLEVLDLSKNNFSGSFPDEVISQLTNLEYLMMNQNNFSGTLPTSLDYLSNLRVFDVSRNNFSGPIPPAIASVGSNKSGLIINMDNNSFSGELPVEMIDSMSSIRALTLSFNNLSGDVANYNWNRHASIDLISLSNNSFTGEMPDLNWPSVRIIALGNNGLSGKFPDISSSTQLRRNRSVGHTNNIGVIQYSFGYGGVTYFCGGSNQFTGPIPDFSFTNYIDADDLDLSCIMVNTNNRNKDIDFSISPNPTEDVFQVNCSFPINEMILFSIDGERLLSQKGGSYYEGHIENPGMYILGIHVADGWYYEKLLVY